MKPQKMDWSNPLANANVGQPELLKQLKEAQEK